MKKQITHDLGNGRFRMIEGEKEKEVFDSKDAAMLELIKKGKTSKELVFVDIETHEIDGKNYYNPLFWTTNNEPIKL